MKILALELSSARGSIAWLDTQWQSARAPAAAGESACGLRKEVFSREWANDRKNSGPFFEHLAEVQKQFGKPDTIVVGLGPGSYAGTRIAISAGIGMSFGGVDEASAEPVEGIRSKENGRRGGPRSTRLIGYPSICAIECDGPQYCVIGDARRNSFFYARVSSRDLADGPTLMTEAELRRKLDKLRDNMPIFTTEKLPQFERAQLRYPAAAMLAQIATTAKGNFARPPLEPIYLREPHITVPKK